MESKVFEIIAAEQARQNANIELIASENFVSENVMRAVGSCLTNKYSEGYPAGHRSGNRGRYYGGCGCVDELEEYCCGMWQQVFGTDYHVNVQPHSGSSANLAAYMSVLKPGDTILAMSLNNGGHLTHGSPVNFSGKLYNMVFYGVDDRGFIDYDDMRRKASAYRPQLILAGASAYSRIIDFGAFAAAAQEVGAYFMVDMAHIAGLVAAGDHPSPLRPGGHHYHHHPQDPAGHTGRPDLLPAGACQAGGQRRFSRNPGRRIAARGGREGRHRRGGLHRGFQALHPRGGPQLQGHVRCVPPDGL